METVETQQQATLNYNVLPIDSLHGEIEIPGDKSISHRALILSSIAEGSSHITGFLEGDDCLATLRALTAMGVRIEGPFEGGVVIVHGVKKNGLVPPSVALDLANSETTLRLLAGLLAGAEIGAELTGDPFLLTRHIDRVVLALRKMGAQITLSADNTAPLMVHSQHPLSGIHYDIPIASSQVKSSMLLAGLFAKGETIITEPVQTRDHTERMLQSFGYRVEKHGTTLKINNEGRLIACHIHVPGDLSSAAFFMVGASIAKQADLLLKRVGINSTRLGVINILRAMGADIEIIKPHMIGAEPVADIRVKQARLKGINIPQEWVISAVDEFPAIFIAAACAQGQTTLTGALQLRSREQRRIQVMAKQLTALGIFAHPTADGLCIEGGEIQGGVVNTAGDHRIAMAFAMASTRANKEINIIDCSLVSKSFPNFVPLANQAGMKIQTYES